MPRLNKKIGDAQRDVSAINGNFDNVALDLSDARGVFSSAVATGGLFIGTDTARTVTINVRDVENKYETGKLPAFLRWTMYVDHDQTGSWIWPIGGNITAVLLGSILISTQEQFYIINPPTDDTKATITMAIANFDAFDHTVYLYLDVFYQPGPDLGIALRAENT